MNITKEIIVRCGCVYGSGKIVAKAHFRQMNPPDLWIHGGNVADAGHTMSDDDRESSSARPSSRSARSDRIGSSSAVVCSATVAQ